MRTVEICISSNCPCLSSNKANDTYLCIMPDEERERFLKKALKNWKFRKKLAAHMVSPLRTGIDYAGLGRKLMVIDTLPQGSLPTYDADTRPTAYIYASKMVFEKQDVPDWCPFAMEQTVLAQEKKKA